MRKPLILGLIIFLFCGCSGQVKSHSPKELLENYLALHKKGDLEGIMDLYYQKNTPAYVLQAVRRAMTKSFKFNVASAEIAEIPAEKLEKVMTGYPYDGKLLVPNLEPVGQIVLKYDQTGQPAEHQAAGSSIMFGTEGGIYYFVLSKVKEDKVAIKVP